MFLQLDITWPGTLPLPSVDYTNAPRNSTLWAPSESTVLDRRSRFEKSYPVLTVSWRFTDQEFDIFEKFFLEDLGNGISQFKIELRYPQNSTLVVWAVRFIGGYQVMRDDASKRLVTSSVELIQTADTVIPEMAAEWDALKIQGRVDGDRLSMWDDTSGHGHMAIETDPARMPHYKEGIFGSSPAVLFDGFNDYLTFQPTPLPSWTFFIVWQAITWTAFMSPFGWRGNGAGFIFRDAVGNAATFAPNLIATDPSDSIIVSKYSHGGLFTPFPSIKAIHVHRWNHLTSAHAFSLNGTPMAAYTLDGYGNPQAIRARIGNGGDSAPLTPFPQYANCYIACIRVYPLPLTDGQVAAVIAELNARFPAY